VEEEEEEKRKWVRIMMALISEITIEGNTQICKYSYPGYVTR
jgi:hypothetical protein